MLAACAACGRTGQACGTTPQQKLCVRLRAPSWTLSCVALVHGGVLSAHLVSCHSAADMEGFSCCAALACHILQSTHAEAANWQAQGSVLHNVARSAGKGGRHMMQQHQHAVRGTSECWILCNPIEVLCWGDHGHLLCCAALRCAGFRVVVSSGQETR